MKEGRRRRTDGRSDTRRGRGGAVRREPASELGVPELDGEGKDLGEEKQGLAGSAEKESVSQRQPLRSGQHTPSPLCTWPEMRGKGRELPERVKPARSTSLAAVSPAGSSQARPAALGRASRLSALRIAIEGGAEAGRSLPAGCRQARGRA